MFTTENAPGDAESGAERRAAASSPSPAAAAPGAPAGRAPLARLADPAWLFATLWQGRFVVLLCAVLGALLAALATMFMTPRYVATAQLFIDPRDLRVLQNEVSPGAASSDPTSTTAFLESQARVIASDSIKSRVVTALRLDRDPEFGGEADKTGIARLLGEFLPDSGAPPRDGRLYALAALDKKLGVRRGERTFVIDITVSSREAVKAAAIANALAEAYLEDQAAVRDSAARRATAALTGRLDELRDKLRQAEDKAERYKEANNLLGVGGRGIGEEQLALNNAQLVAVRTRLTEARAKYDQIAATRASGIEAGALPEAVASNTMTALRSQLGAALNREADLLAAMGGRHPSLISAQAQVRDARRQIAEELDRIRRAARVELDRASDAERQLSRRLESLKSQQFAVGRASVELRELEREVESARVVYEGFLRRARETEELAGIDTTNARVISPAMPPLEKTAPARRTITLAGAVLGGGLGTLLVLASALSGAAPGLAGIAALRRRPAPPEPEPEPSVPVLPPSSPSPPPPAAAAPIQLPAVIVPPAPPAEPASEPPPTVSRLAKWRRRFTAITGGQGRTAEAVERPPAVALPLLATLPPVKHRRWRRTEEARSVFQSKSHLVDVLDKPNGAFARAIGELRQELAGAEIRGRSLLVLGVRPGAGASTLALNLALGAALAGEPAMLIDAASGGQGLTAVFAPEVDQGLGDVAAGRVAIVRAALQDEGTNLFFLPRPGAAPLPGADTARGVLVAARRFAPVVIDGGVVAADPLAAQFAEAVDEILLVVRAGAAGLRDVEQAVAALGADGAKVRGYVVNEA